jgi:hypothetical protein
MAREMRFSRENIHQVLEEMNLVQKKMKEKRAKRFGRASYEPSSQEQFDRELRASQ